MPTHNETAQETVKTQSFLLLVRLQAWHASLGVSQLLSPRTAFRMTGVGPSDRTSTGAELPLKSQSSRYRIPLL